jgi:transposase InsO family protein
MFAAHINSALKEDPISSKVARSMISNGARAFVMQIGVMEEATPQCCNAEVDTSLPPPPPNPPEQPPPVDQHPPELKKVLDEYADVFAPLPAGLPPDRGQGHVIPLLPGATPTCKGMYRLSPKELEECAAQVKDLLAKGFIVPSTSPYAASILFVNKKDGGLRMCLDYRALNAITVRNNYPLPRIQDLFDQLHGATIFSSLDLQSGYYQIRIPEEDHHKTAFRTPMGLFQFRVLTFGLTNAPATFQAEMNRILAPFLRKFVVVYLDDILIFSKSKEEHYSHLAQVLEVLRREKFFAKLSKCEFLVTELKFLGHLVGKDGIRPDPSKLAAVKDWPVPTTVKKLQSFLGLANYFRKFLLGYSSLVAPLVKLCCKSTPSKPNPWVWTEDHQQRFEKVKEMLISAPLLALPDPDKPFEIISDASLYGTGAILLQENKPISYTSAQFIPAEKNYFTTEQECLGVIKAFEEWRCYIEGGKHPVTLVTDHHPLTYLKTQPTMSRRIARWVEYLERFNYVWKYIPGRTNVADPLSRHPRFTPSVALAEAEAADEASPPIPLLTFIKESYREDPNFQKARFTKDLVFADGLWRRSFPGLKSLSKIVIPNVRALRNAILEEYHNSCAAGHLGPKRTTELLSRWFYWRGMSRDAQAYCASCKSCQMNKPTNLAPAGTLQPLEIPDAPWDSWSMDFITCLPKTKKGHDTLLVLVDRLTKYVIAVPTVATNTAEDVARLCLEHVISKHGVPLSIVSDRDVRFTSAFWKTLQSALGTKLCMSTSFHPQTDGQTERMNRALEETLRHVVSHKQDDWDLHIPMATFAINNAHNQSIDNTPFFLNKGFHPRMPAGITNPEVMDSAVPAVEKFTTQMQEAIKLTKAALYAAQQRQKAYADTHRREVSFAVGDLVYLSTKNLKLKNDNLTVARQKLLPKFVGPYKVLELVGPVAVKLSLPPTTKIHPVFHVSLLKPAQEAQHEPGEIVPPINPPPLDWLDPDLEYEVEGVIGHRFTKSGTKRGVDYLIRWAGYGPDSDTFEPRESLMLSIPELVLAYDAEHHIVLPKRRSRSSRAQAPDRRPKRARCA